MLIFRTNSILEVDYIYYSHSYDEIIFKKNEKEMFKISRDYEKQLISHFTYTDFLTKKQSNPENLRDVYECIKEELYENGKVKLPI